MAKKQKWRLLKGSWISNEPVLPRVWQRKEGGHVVRARVIDRSTGRQREIWKVLPQADAPTALKWIDDETKRIRAGAVSAEAQRLRFCDYATSLFERKVATKEIKSARGRERWQYTLAHLIAGTGNVDDFGEIFIDELRPMHVEIWRAGIGKLIAKGAYSPTTANGWLNILRHVVKRAKRELQLPFNAAEGIPAFDTSEHETYTEEEPNSLSSEEAASFLGCLKAEFPTQYAMAFLGFATGLRPSTMRPLRRTGPTPDVLWDQGVVLVRRSHMRKIPRRRGRCVRREVGVLALTYALRPVLGKAALVASCSVVGAPNRHRSVWSEYPIRRLQQPPWARSSLKAVAAHRRASTPTTVRARWFQSQRSRTAVQLAGAAPAVHDATCLLMGTSSAIVMTSTMAVRTAATANKDRTASPVRGTDAMRPSSGSISDGGIVFVNRRFSIWNRRVQLSSGRPRAAYPAMKMPSIIPASRPKAERDTIATMSRMAVDSSIGRLLASGGNSADDEYGARARERGLGGSPVTLGWRLSDRGQTQR
jgi:hypothetical protein